MWIYNEYHRHGLSVTHKGSGRIRIFNKGKGNIFMSGKNARCSNLFIEIRGNNNSIVIGDNVSIRKNCHFSINGNDSKNVVGENCSMTSFVHLECNENEQSIIIGKDCMFSNHIHIRTNDSHPIYTKGTNSRINPPKSVNIGNHVWLGASVTILKGVHIDDGSIVGAHSIVTHDIPANMIAVGIPARIVKENVEWTYIPR